MWRTVIFLVCVAVVLGLADRALADTYSWTDGDAGNSSWCDTDNWNPKGLPGSLDTAQIDETSPERGPIIDCAVDVGFIDGPKPVWGNEIRMDVNYSGTVNIGAWLFREGTGTSIININGIPDVTIGGERWGFPDSGVGILNISGDPNIVVQNEIRGADNDDGMFYLNMSGGRLDIGDELVIGDNGGGEINLSGGSIIVAGTAGAEVSLGGKRGVAPVTVNMTGGSITTVEFQLPANANRAGVVRVNLHGGVINCDQFLHGSYPDDVASFTDDWLLDVEEGTLKITGDVKDAIDVNVAAGQIIAYDGDGTVVVELIGGNTVVTALAPDPLTATKPNPRIGSENVDPNVVLSWMPGTSADTHDVYFGTSLDDVNDAGTTDGVFIGNQEPNTFDPCGAGVPLDYLTTYYWRIDEVSGSTTYKGRVWYFTTGTVIIDPNMIAYYKFDETEGAVAADSSGYGWHASIYVRNNQPPYWDPNDGHDGGSLPFHKTTSGEDEGRGVTSVQPPSGLLSDIGGEITFAVWLKDSYNHEAGYGETPDNWLFDTGTGGETGQYHVQAAVPRDDEKHVLWRAGNDANDALEWDLGGASAKDLKGWHHWAFVKDENQDEMHIYFDGKAVESKIGVDDTLANVSNAPFKIGATTWVNYDYAGHMDNFRVYDCALLASEVSKLFRGGDVELAWGPSPFDGQTDVPRNVNLIWKPGDYVALHDVYFGTDFNDVNNATTVSGVYESRQEPNEFDPEMLQFDTTYYWRIDEVNDPNVWKGKVWRFTVMDFLVIDDFESYDKSENWIYDTWEDGYVNWTGSEVDLGIEPINPAHGGDQSMIYEYYNDGGFWGDLDYYSEASRTIADPRNWADLNMKILTLFFYGDGGNDTNATEQMYVGLEDTRGTGSYAQVDYGYYGEDMNDLKEDEWQEWNIALSDFNGVILTDVNKVCIGFGIRGNPNPGGTPGGSGAVYFDNIRLHMPRCVSSILKPVADLSNNCVVDFADVEIMAQDWLQTDSLPVEAPDPGPVGHWELDGSADDSSTNGNHGTAEGTYAWVAGRIGTNAIEFSGDGGKILVPDAAELRPADQLSVTAWVNTSITPDYQARIVSKGLNADNRDNFGLCVNENDQASFYVRDANGENYTASGQDELTPGEWHHIAGTYDGSSVNCYVNGRLDESDSNVVIILLQDTNSLAIGNMVDADRAYFGKVDDVQVYDYALYRAQVAYLATENTGYMPLTSEANLYDGEPVGQKAINFKDYTVLAGSWLEEKLWPTD